MQFVEETAKSSPVAGLPAAKAELRERMRAIRRGLSPQDRTRLGEAVASRLVGLAEIERASTVMVFSSFGSEIPTDPAIRLLAAAGRTLLLPFLVEGRMDAAAFRPEEPLVATAYGPREPAHPVAVDPSTVQAAVVPGLAFDRRGNRLGYGGGHYDRYLRRLGPDAARVGVCFHEQLVEAVPHGPDDQRVHLVITDREAVDCREGE